MNRWEQVEKICQAALELEESQRAAFLDQACAGDAELRQEVESLLQFDTRGDHFIEKAAVEVAAKMIAHEGTYVQMMTPTGKPSPLFRVKISSGTGWVSGLR